MTPSARTDAAEGLGDFAPDTTARLHAERFLANLGRETPLVDGARSLGSWVKSMRAPVVGAHYLTCSDECEEEAARTFDRHFVRYLLPSISFFDKAPFRSENLGARYEWGSIGVAEEHFSRAKGAEQGKVFVLKLHSHVATEDTPEGQKFGRMARYMSPDSTACGALALLLEGARNRPFLVDLEEAFWFEGVDRLTQLQGVEAGIRPLVAAVVHARLQARRAMLEIQELTAVGPTCFIVLACVTLNRSGRDTELPIGMYLADHRGATPNELWIGVSDLPHEIAVALESTGVQLRHPGLATARPARDHRRLMRAAWSEGSFAGAAPEEGERVRSVLTRIKAAAKADGMAKTTLKALSPLLLELTPVPAAAILFGVGALSIHHTSRAHRLRDVARRDDAARQMLSNVQHEIDALTPAQAEHALLLLREDLTH